MKLLYGAYLGLAKPPRTMTVGELIAALQQYPADMPVVCTHEQALFPLDPGCFAVQTAGTLAEDTLLIAAGC